MNQRYFKAILFFMVSLIWQLAFSNVTLAGDEEGNETKCSISCPDGTFCGGASECSCAFDGAGPAVCR